MRRRAPGEAVAAGPLASGPPPAGGAAGARLKAGLHAALVLALGLSLGAGLIAGAAGAAGAAESHDLKYKFEEGTKSTYEITVELDATTTARKGDQKDRSSTKTEITLLMDAVDHVKGEGDRVTNTLGVTFRGLKVEQEIDGPAGALSLKIEGKDVELKRGGRPIVDTKENKGTDIAKGLLGEFAFLDEEGTLTVEANGRVSDVSGPEALSWFLSAETGAGLFVLETKGEPVRKGMTWRSEERTVTILRELDISVNPLRPRLSYTLEEIVERDGRKVAKIAVKSGFKERDLSGKITREALRHAPLAISRMEREVEGVVYFDIERGKVVEADVNVKKLSVEAELKVRDRKTRKEETVATEMNLTARVRLELVETTKVEPPPAPGAGADESGEADEPGGADEAGGADGTPAPAAPDN